MKKGRPPHHTGRAAVLRRPLVPSPTTPAKPGERGCAAEQSYRVQGFKARIRSRNLLPARRGARLLVALSWALGLFVGVAQSQTAPNFTLLDHQTGQPVSLHDLAGSVVLLEFFATWCPHCQAASPQIKTNIHDYYQTIAGNPAGIPVAVLYISVASDRPSVDAFMQNYGLDFVVDDTPQYTTYNLYGGGGVPKFVVINGVTNSTTHQPWQVLCNTNGYVEGVTVPTLRSYINAVRGTLCPNLTNLRVFTNTTFQAAFRAQNGCTHVVEATADWVNWVTITNIIGSNTVRFYDAGLATNRNRFYRLRVE